NSPKNPNPRISTSAAPKRLAASPTTGDSEINHG
uniref:Uncharacterized protein n=1 Tax=Solanum lycopersicum TaxID=4081 RepID=A0A3Q7J354_SOLLC